MSRLPNADQAFVDERKVRNYLLSTTHARETGKLALFEAFGFRASAWPALVQALCRHATENDVVATRPSEHGERFVVECTMVTPDGRNPCLRTIWIIRGGEQAPRFVTAYGATP